MASSAGGFASVEDARQYLATLNARGDIKLAKPAGQLSSTYAKSVANALHRQELAGRAKLSLAEARRHGTSEHHQGRAVTLPGRGRAPSTSAIGPAPTKVFAGKGESRKGLYRGGKVPQVPEIIDHIKKRTKSNIITIGIYGYVSFYYDDSIQPGIRWLAMVVDKQEFLNDLQRLNTGAVRKADDPELRALAVKYMTRNRPNNVGVDWAYIFRWSARDAKQP